VQKCPFALFGNLSGAQPVVGHVPADRLADQIAQPVRLDGVKLARNIVWPAAVGSAVPLGKPRRESPVEDLVERDAETDEVHSHPGLGRKGGQLPAEVVRRRDAGLSIGAQS
jgi:hypothetical protein